MEQATKKMSFFGFFALTAAMVLTVYEYPTFATAKFHLVFFVLLGGFFWFVPVALISAELASVEGLEKGGIFGWVGHLLGEKYGFAAIFYEWFQSTICFITMSYFIVSVVSDVFHLPILEHNMWMKFLAVAILFWVMTLCQWHGVEKTVQLAKWGMILGIILPTVLFCILSVMYLLEGNPLRITMNWQSFVPDFHQLSTLVVASSFVLAFGGIEASASHVNELSQPKKNYPLVIVTLMVMTILLDGLGGLSIAAVVPQSKLSLSDGVIQAFRFLLNYFIPHSEWLVVVIAICLIFGVVAQISSWIMGPSKTLYIAAQEHLLPHKLTKVNRYGIPTTILIVQGVIVTLWDALLTFGSQGAGNVSFFVSVSLTSVIYLCAYLLMFGAYFMLIFKYPHRKRTYQAVSNRFFKLLIACSGTFLSVATLMIAFIKPSALSQNEGSTYQWMLMVGTLIMVVLPFIIYHYRNLFSKQTVSYRLKHRTSHEVEWWIHMRGRSEFQLVKDKEEKRNS